MLRVRLEIVPFGDESRTREIGRLDIFNKGEVRKTPLGRLCSYGVIDLTKNQEGLYIDDIVHLRETGAWPLVRKVLTMVGTGP